MRPKLILITALAFFALFNASAQASDKPATPTPAATTTAKKLIQGVNAADTGNSSTQQIEKTVHQYLMKKPEVVVEALQAYQQKQMESMQQLFKDTQEMAPRYVDLLFHQDVDPVGGNASGKITVVEFSDYQCDHCIKIASIINAAVKAHSNLRIIIKEFPIRGLISDMAARAALAANKQGKYWEFRETLFKNGSNLSEDKIYELAQNIGLNVEQLKKDMNDPAIRKEVEDNRKLGTSLKLIGTPAFFIAKSDVKQGAPSSTITYVPGFVSQQQLDSIISQLNNAK